MLFRPNFCANCGEKIERSDWGFFTSRRFCQVCESVCKEHDLLPRVVVVLGIVFGLFGIGGYLKSGSSIAENQSAKQPRRFAEQAMPVAQAAPKEVSISDAQPMNKAALPVSEIQSAAPMPKFETQRPKPAMPQIETIPEVYMCGAQTAKGTPCKRRVKGSVRCYQHPGMPALLPPDKLRLN